MPVNPFITPLASLTVTLNACAAPWVTVAAKSSSFNKHGPDAGQTVKVAGELSVPPTETTMFAGPAVMLGTVTVIDLSAHDAVGILPTGVFPNFTLLSP